jgi:alkylation response protein AidB-like acyl-CoA dehydrogenase
MESSLQMFEREAPGFLEAHAKPLPPSDVVWGQGSDKVTTGEQLSDAQERDRLETAQAWRALEYDNGSGWITGRLQAVVDQGARAGSRGGQPDTRPKADGRHREWGTFSWSDLVLQAPGVRIAAGTDEIMRNILAERVLGLPDEPSG